MAAGVPFE
jgi:hypothetical protein